MTTPGTAEVRAWAREQGISVAERGRLPAELRDAYAAAQAAGGGPATAARATREAPAAKTVQRRAGTPAKAPAKAPAKSPAAKSAAGAKAATARTAARTAVVSEPGPRARPAAAEMPEKATDRAPAALPAAPPAPADDTRLVRLEAALAALTARVTELEKPRPDKPALFRRKKG